MYEAGESFENPRTGTRIEFREWTPDRTVFDRTYPPDSGRADPHVHYDLFQSWEVLSGRARTVVDGQSRELETGDMVEIEREVPHQDIHNPYDSELRVRWTVTPANDFVEAFADCYTHYLTRDELNKQDEFKALQIIVLLHATRAQSYLNAIPRWLQKPLLPLGALAGRLRGYRAGYERTG
jgi:mannose-6-phosphate isomerase-like protein (cupin superfamily)